MRRVFLACLAVSLLWTASAFAQTRHAFVVGIDTYDNVGSLAKARNDARAVADALEEAGFRTQLVIDADETALLTELTRFSSQLDPGDEVVFYFAGHGVEINGRNYLLPADVPSVAPGQELVVTRGALPVSSVIDQFNARGVRLSLLILDACRDNPFETLGTRSLGRSVGLGREEAPEGTFVMFSAGAGQQALDRLSTDDPNPNSVFTRVLLPRLTEPGLSLRTMVREVRSEVRALGRTVAHEQFPAVYDQLDGAFTFVPVAVAAPAIEAATPEVAQHIDPCAAARADWAFFGVAPSVYVLEIFLQTHDDCALLAAMATERLATLTEPASPVITAPASLVSGQPEPVAEIDIRPPVEIDTSPTEPTSADLLEACVADHPVSRVWEYPSRDKLDRAQLACEASLQALSDTSTADYAHVTGLLGRLEGFRSNWVAAFDMNSFAAENGDAMAAGYLGGLYQLGFGVAVNGELAAFWNRRAGEGGIAGGWLGYGALYDFGEIVPQNDEQALIGYRAAFDLYLVDAEAGDSHAAVRLGSMYEHGLGVEVNSDLAADWYRRSQELRIGEGR